MITEENENQFVTALQAQTLVVENSGMSPLMEGLDESNNPTKWYYRMK